MASLARPATTRVAHAAAACDDYEAQADAQRATDTRDPDGDGIYCGGESPRIVNAEVVGSPGVTESDGATLRAKLGLTDTWSSVVSSSGRKGRSSRAPRSFAFRSVGTLRGTVIGPPRRGGPRRPDRLNRFERPRVPQHGLSIRA
jgi:hypothetical protein